VEIIFEFILQFVLETLLQIFAETLAEFGLHCTAQVFERRPTPWMAAIGYAILGTIAGAISVFIVPSLIASFPARVANLAVTPVVAGAAMCLVGLWRRHRGQELIRLDRFAYGYLFALAMALVRFYFAK
jgi:hypothetical protein